MSPVRRAVLFARRALAALAVLGSGCVTTYEPEPLGVTREQLARTLPAPVAIPFPKRDVGAEQIDAFYSRVLERLQGAAADRDVALIESLLQSYDKQDLPAHIAAHLRGYRGVARGLLFEQHVARSGRLELRPSATEPADRIARARVAGAASQGSGGAEVPPLGEALRLELRLPAGPEPVRLGGRDDENPIGFSVSVSVADAFVDGSSRSLTTDEFVWLPRAVDLEADVELTVPIDIDLPSGDAVRRTIAVRVDLMPGYVRAAGERAPVHRTGIGGGTFVQWPRGHGALQAEPLATLRRALTPFTPSTFAAAWVAALAVPVAQRDEAIDLLVDQVRFGRADQAQVAMAILREITGVQLALGDRDAWLAWAQSRR